MFKIILTMLLTVVATMIITSTIQPLSYLQTFAKQEGCRNFPQTERAVCGKFLAYWEKHGGLPVFGYPISNEFAEEINPPIKVKGDFGGDNAIEYLAVQYFERAIFEYHPENKAPYDVQLSLVGVSQFAARYSNQGLFLGNLPLYPKADILSVSHDTHANGGVDMCGDNVTTFSTRDSPKAVFAYYRQMLVEESVKHKWETATNTENPNNLNITLISRVPAAGHVYPFPALIIDLLVINRGSGATRIKMTNIEGCGGLLKLPTNGDKP